MPTSPSAAAAVPAQIDDVRAFTRFYTHRLGVLDEGLHASGFTLAQSRVLYELGTRRQASAADLVAALDLDPGYLSRILRGFATRDLLVRRRAAADARRIDLSLTAAGRKAFALLDRRARAQVAGWLEPLSDGQRERLVDALGDARTLLGGEPPAEPDPATAARRTVRLRSPKVGDIGWAIARHGELYAQEYGWDASFEALVASLFAAFAVRHDPRTERCWIAELDNRRAGCTFVVRNADDPGAAQLRCLLVEPSARGAGVGRALVRKAIDFARRAGYPRMMLWTNDILVAARRIYVAEGFTLEREEKHRSFGASLVGQIWTLDLSRGR